MTLGPRRVRPHSGAGRARDPGLSWRRPHVHAPPCRPPGRRCFRVACLTSLSRTLSGAPRQHSPGRGPAGLVIAAPGPWPGGSLALSLSEAPCGPGSCREWPIRCRLSELQFEALRLATARDSESARSRAESPRACSPSRANSLPLRVQYAIEHVRVPWIKRSQHTC